MDGLLYLSTEISKSGKCSPEIQTRLGIASER